MKCVYYDDPHVLIPTKITERETDLVNEYRCLAPEEKEIIDKLVTLFLYNHEGE